MPGGSTIDLSQATYMDSAGIQAIIAIYARMRESEGCLVTIVGSIRLRKVIEVIHLEQLPGVRIRQTLDEARQAMPSSNTHWMVV